MDDFTPANYGLSATPEAELAQETTNELPRAVLRSGHHVLLDGTWRFAIDLDDIGLTEDWEQGYDYRLSAQWPGSIEEHMAAAHSGGPTAWQDKIVAWYEREFALPEVVENKDRTLFQLTFGACGYETRVWLNGQLLTTIEGEAVHYGEYTSFSYELPEEHLRATNRLTVRIADTMDAETTRGKQESHVYKRGGIWYQTQSGAVRSVWLETVERNRLRSRVGVVSTIEDCLVRFNLTLRVYDAGDYQVRLQVFGPDGAAGGAPPLAASDFPLTLAQGQHEQRLSLEVPGAEVWCPEHPHRYRLVAQLIDHTGYAAQIEARFGLRKIESRGRKVYLNNEPIYLDGILYQPGTATYAEMRRHMHAMKALGCNLVRVHIAGVDPRIYNLADELGLLLWVEVPSPHSSTPRSRENHRAELLRMLSLMETHPSIVIWSLYNEDWGAQDIATNPATRRYIVQMYHYMQLAHPQFLVIDNDGWHHISHQGQLKSDLLTAHLYTPDLGRWRELLDRLIHGEMQGTAAFPLVVGDPYFYRGQRPLLVSEWGGFGFPDYGGPADAEARTNSIRAFKQELRQRPIAGDVYTQATNIEDERNGLIGFHSGELEVPAGLLHSREG